ncbi:MAG: peptidoglycan editing factor PgeF [Gemmatimonadota bacterium]
MKGEAIHPEWIVPDWRAPAQVRAFVTTRAGGVSSGPYGAPSGGGMNVGLSTGDDVERVRTNRLRLRAALPAEPRWLRQVHGAVVVDAAAIEQPIEGDASFSSEPNVVCAVSIADCMPVFLADELGRAVAVAHAGWRGLAAGVIQNSVAALRARIGQPDARLHAWLGPTIGPLRFEVGGEVLEAMQSRLPRARDAFKPREGGKYLADLPALARQALGQVGVDQAGGGDLCTYSDPLRFYSYRRDRITGRHAAVIWLDSGRSLK